MNKFLKYFMLFYLFHIFPVNMYSKNDVLQKIQNTIEYKPHELIFAIFLNLGDCFKYLQVPLSTFECALQKLDPSNSSLRFKKLVIVNCHRKIEMKRFRKLYNWDGFCLFNDGSVQKELGLPSNVWFSIFYKDTCLYYNTYENSCEQSLNCDSLSNYLRKIKLQIKRGKL